MNETAPAGHNDGSQDDRGEGAVTGYRIEFEVAHANYHPGPHDERNQVPESAWQGASHLGTFERIIGFWRNLQKLVKAGDLIRNVRLFVASDSSVDPWEHIPDPEAYALDRTLGTELGARKDDDA